MKYNIFIFSEKYVSDAESLHEHVMRHNHGTDENGVSINCMKIAFDAEYPLHHLFSCILYTTTSYLLV